MTNLFCALHLQAPNAVSGDLCCAPLASPDVSSLCWPGDKSSASCGLWHLRQAHRAVSHCLPLLCQAPHYQHPVQLPKCPVLLLSCNNFSVLVVPSVSAATCVTQWETEESKMCVPSPGRKPVAVSSSFSCFSLFIFPPSHTLAALLHSSDTAGQIKGVLLAPLPQFFLGGWLLSDLPHEFLCLLHFKK